MGWDGVVTVWYGIILYGIPRYAIWWCGMVIVRYGFVRYYTVVIWYGIVWFFYRMVLCGKCFCF